MSPTPPSTTPSSGGRSPEEPFRVVRKRNRVPVSCYPCRTRKKCDRSHPCSNCVKREGSDTTSCSYATPVARKKHQSQGASSPDDMQNRIDRLEGLVLSLMHGGANISAATAAAAGAAGAARAATVAHSTTDSASSGARIENDHGDEASMNREGEEDSDSDDGLANSLGVLKVDSDKGKSLYIGQEHWHTILADISEVKNYFISHKKELEKSYERVASSKPAMAREGPTFLTGVSPASEVELRAELPPKTSVLTLCARYFNSMDNAVNIIHAPTFHQQLRSHWQDPSKTPIMWLGLLYSVLCLAMLSYHKVGDEPPEWKGRTLEMAAEYRVRTVQCLIAADYTKPVDYTVETMILYVFGEYSSRWDAELGLWLIVSLITRIAFRMGYHRDAKWFPSLTPFQAEMRRRTWALVRMSDIFFSHQLSLPSMIYDHDCDTQLPTNVFDEEFGPDTKVLPPSRPRTEPTPIAYMIAKATLSIEMGNILQATTKIGTSPPYDEILRLDARLREIHAELPPHLKMAPLDGSGDPVTLIIARFNLDILYQKVLCLLHRKYLVRARHNSRYAHSRRTAIEASLDTLRHLATLHRESQPGGRLRSLKWYFNTIATKDFLLPAMLLALDLHYDCSGERGLSSISSSISSPSSSTAAAGASSFSGSGGRQNSQALYFWTPEQRREMVECLSRTREIWHGLRDESMEAYKASSVLEVMLEKIKSSAASSSRGSASADHMGTGSFGAQGDFGIRGAAGDPMKQDILFGGQFGSGNELGGSSSMQQEHSAAMTLGMLSSDNSSSSGAAMTPNTAAFFDSAVQSPGGGIYSNMDLSGGGGGGGGSGGDAGGSAGPMATDFPPDVFSMANAGAPSPLSMFTNMGTGVDLGANFDWDALETYTQTANWGGDQGFQFFAGNPEQVQPGSADQTQYL